MSDVKADVKVLTPADLAGADTVRRVEPVDVPEWGGRVYVRELTALETARIDDAVFGEGDKAKTELIAPAWVAGCLCDADGKPFYVPGDVGAVLAIGAKSARAVRRVYEVAVRLNGRRKEDPAAGKDDSGAAPAADSPSGSPSPSAAST